MAALNAGVGVAEGPGVWHVPLTHSVHPSVASEQSEGVEQVCPHIGPAVGVEGVPADGVAVVDGAREAEGVAVVDGAGQSPEYQTI